MRVLMLGWELAPYVPGDLGAACRGLTRALTDRGVEVVFVLPRPVNNPAPSHVTLVTPRPGRGGEWMRRTSTGAGGEWPRDPYLAPGDAALQTDVPGLPPADRAPQKADDPFAEVRRYATLAGEVARAGHFDLVHAHDWRTFPAGLTAAGIRRIPLVAHVHSTGFDRAGASANPRVLDAERRGMHGAVRVLAASHSLREQAIQVYGMDPVKVSVVHDEIDAVPANGTPPPDAFRIDAGEKLVLFLAGPDAPEATGQFLAAADRVLDAMGDVRFVVAGRGEAVRDTVRSAEGMGIGQKVLFSGFLRGDGAERVLRTADLYVLAGPSPTVLPGRGAVPLLLSRDAALGDDADGVARADFGNATDLADRIIALLRHPASAASGARHDGVEVRRLTWSDAADATLDVYEQALDAMGRR